METLKTIKLSGSLASRFGRVHNLAVANAAEAVRALCATRPGFEKYMMESKDNGLVFAIFSGKETLSEDQLHNPSGQDVIRIVPVISGSKKAGMMNIIVGAVIVIVSAVIDYFTAGAFGAATGYSTYAMGISMMVGGIIQLLTPVPKNEERKDDPRKSYLFNGAVNVQAQGNCVPVLYGELIIGSVVVSAGISSEDNYVVPYSAGGVGDGSYRGGGSMMGNVMERARNAAQ